MPFQKGVVSNPLGRTLEKAATDALRIAALELIKSGKHKGKVKLRRTAERIMDMAMAGQPWACNMVFDRLDGRAVQAIEQSVTYEVGEVFIDLLRQMNEVRQGKVIEHQLDLVKPTEPC